MMMMLMMRMLMIICLQARRKKNLEIISNSKPGVQDRSSPESNADWSHNYSNIFWALVHGYVPFNLPPPGIHNGKRVQMFVLQHPIELNNMRVEEEHQYQSDKHWPYWAAYVDCLVMDTFSQAPFDHASIQVGPAHDKAPSFVSVLMIRFICLIMLIIFC